MLQKIFTTNDDVFPWKCAHECTWRTGQFWWRRLAVVVIECMVKFAKFKHIFCWCGAHCLGWPLWLSLLRVFGLQAIHCANAWSVSKVWSMHLMRWARYLQWIWVTLVLTPSRWTRYCKYNRKNSVARWSFRTCYGFHRQGTYARIFTVGSRVALTFLFKMTLYFFFALPTVLCFG